MNKDMGKLLEAAERQGFQVRRSGSDHFLITTASGERVATASGSPRDGRSLRNIRAALRRHGYRP